MNSFEQDLMTRLARIREYALFRELRRIDAPQSPHIEIRGRSFLNFSSNDYLGLANHSALKEAAIGAIERYGAGSGASRLICGSLAPHDDLEGALAEFKGTERALVFSSGYAAAVGTLTALLSKGDIIIVDKLVHASIVDGARLSGATLRVFPHNNLDALAKILQQCERDASKGARTLIVTESVFSMDGDQAPLREIVELKDRWGAWLMVDEAHATGLYGSHRRGLAEELAVDDQIEIKMGTLGKAFGASGGYVCGSGALIDYLINKARSFVFSTAPVPAASAAATAGIRLVASALGATRNRDLWTNVENFRDRAMCALPASSDSKRNVTALNNRTNPNSAIVPFEIGNEDQAVKFAEALNQRGIFVPAIRYPTVARGRARLRITFTAAHEQNDIDSLVEALRLLEKATGSDTHS
jgi:8-amino-7-oxononanoate synthase